MCLKVMRKAEQGRGIRNASGERQSDHNHQYDYQGSLIGHMIFEQRCERVKRSPMGIWEKSVPDRGNSSYKGFGKGLISLEHNKEGSEARVEWSG